MVLTKKRPHVAIQDGKIGSAPFTTVDALDAPGRSGRFLGTPVQTFLSHSNLDESRVPNRWRSEPRLLQNDSAGHSD